MLKKHSLTFYYLNLYILLMIMIPKSFSTILNIIPIRLFLTCILFLIVIIELKQKKIEFNQIKTKKYIWIYLIFILFTIPSIFISKNIIVSLYTFIKFISYIFLFLFILKIKFTKEEYKKIIVTFIISAIFIIAFGFREYYFFEDIFKPGIEKYNGAKGRVEITFLNTIYVGIFLNTIFSYLLYFYFKTKEKTTNIILFVINSLIYAIIIMTFTRSSMMIFWFAISLFILLNFKKNLNLKMLLLLMSFILITNILPGATELIKVSFNNSFIMLGNKNFYPTFSEDENIDLEDPSLNEREQFALISKRISKENVITGVGFGTYLEYINSDEFTVSHETYSGAKAYPHSAIILLLSETGIISLIFFSLFVICLLFDSFKNILKFYKKKNTIYELSVVTFIVTVGFFVVNIIAENAIYDTQVFPLFLVVIGLSLNKINELIFKEEKKLLFISSTGGHLDELLQLKPMFKKYDYHLITEKTKSTIGLKEEHKEKIDYLIYGTKAHMLIYPFKLFANTVYSLYLYLKINPTHIITTGTHTAVPMCYIAKIFGSKVIFIETFANIKTKTLSGRMVYPIADEFIVQWEPMLKLYPKSILGGWIY